MKTSNKKYSDYIDFPVEIVGKDGVVRYYTFEESVIYQRRIRLCRLRYDTPSARKKRTRALFEPHSPIMTFLFCTVGVFGLSQPLPRF